MSRFAQKSFGLFQALITFFLIAMLTMLALRLGPVYMENMHVHSIVKGVLSQQRLIQMGGQAIQLELNKEFIVNHLNHVSAHNIFIQQLNQHIQVEVNYEVRVPMIGNIDMIIHFDNKFEAS